MISVKNSYEIAYNGTENECRFELYADTAGEMVGVTHYDGIKIQMGSECTVIATGDKYILNGSGAWILQPSDCAFSNVYTKAEIDSMITEIYDIIAYYHTTLVSDTGEITFYSLGGNVGTCTIYGNGQQTGTPAPDAPIMPTFCGMLDGTDWKIPITCAGQTVPVYLGQTQTVRKVKKLVLTGKETFTYYNTRSSKNVMNLSVPDSLGVTTGNNFVFCTHLPRCTQSEIYSETVERGISTRPNSQILFYDTSIANTPADFKAYLAAQYANGTPVTVWYVLATPETAIVNEPLAKIADYADELHSEDAAVTIPTAKGQNTLTVDTILKPSLIEISGGITHE